MSRPKLNEEQIAKLQGQIAITKDGKRYIFNSAKEALEYIRKNTPEGYNVYDTTSYTRNYDPKINEHYSSKEQKDIKNRDRLDELEESGHSLLEITPVVGDVMDWYNTGKAVYNIGEHALTNDFDMQGLNPENYYTAGIGLGGLFIPNLLEKPAKKLINFGHNLYKNTKNKTRKTLRHLKLDYKKKPKRNSEEVITEYEPFILDDSYGEIPMPPPAIAPTRPTVNAETISPTFSQRFTLNTPENDYITVDLSEKNPLIGNQRLFDFENPIRNLSYLFNHNINNPNIENLIKRIENHPTFQYTNPNLSNRSRLYNWLRSRERYRPVLNHPVKLDNGWTVDAITGTAISPEGFATSYRIGNKDIVPKKPHHYTDDYVAPKTKKVSQLDENGVMVEREVEDYSPVFTGDDYPGKGSMELIEGKDITHMSHFDMSPEAYSRRMTYELYNTPHGAAIGFDHNGAISTSSSMMFPLQLIKGMNNGTISEIFSPLNKYNGDQTLVLNNYGRMYTRTPRGIKAVPGTEDFDFHTNIYNPNNLKYIPDTKKLQFSPIRLQKNKSKIKPTVPLISKQEWVDNFNETRVKPLNEILHIKYPERSFQNAFVDERGYIHVPTMAGRKRKEGGKLIKINKNGIN